MNPAGLPVVLTRRAEKQVTEAAHWWAKNRLAAPDAVAEEVARGIELIAIFPAAGTPATNHRLAGVRRLLLERIRYFLYFRVRPKLGRVEVLAFWHASRGEGPP